MTKTVAKSPRHLSIIGFGRVGQALAFLLGGLGEPVRVNLIDPVPNLGAYEDILHSYQIQGSELTLNDHEALLDSDVIFHCAGPSVPKGAPRLSVARESLELTKTIFEPLDLEEKSPLIVVLANPVDLVCLQIQRVTKMDPSKVLGTGTLLDTHRFNSLMDRELDLPPGTSQAVVLGEHGNSMNLWLGGSFLHGKPIADSVSSQILGSVFDRTRTMARYIKKYQGATFFGVARCAVRIWRQFLAQDIQVIPLSVQVGPEYRKAWKGQPFWMSLPCRVGQGQATAMALSEEDRLPLEKSAQKLRLAWPRLELQS